MQRASTSSHQAPFAPRTPGVAIVIVSSLILAATALAVVPEPSIDSNAQAHIIETLSIDHAKTLSTEGQIFFSETKILRGDTLHELLLRLNIRDDEARGFIESSATTSPLWDQFIAGKVVSARSGTDGRLQYLYFPLKERESALLIERIDSSLAARIVAERPETHVASKTANIEHSLFSATDSAGIPDSVAIQVAELFGGEIDFHKDLRKGDRLTVSYEMHHLNGRPTRSGRILAVEFVNGDSVHRAILFSRKDGSVEYLTPEGKSLQRAFLRSPLEFSRISSGFSVRFHPILQQWRAHKGVDYAAPTGTKVRATGNATVEFAGNQKGYGTTIILRHDNKHSTLYAHLSRIAPGIRKGTRIRQGETIGLVGQTGWATGPHLHYEFKVNDQAVNPLSIKLPVAAAKLTPAEKLHFETQAKMQLELLDNLKHTQVAYLE